MKKNQNIKAKQVKLFPFTSLPISCPLCGNRLSSQELLIQGIHSCVKGSCQKCDHLYVADLPTGHANYDPYIINISTQHIHGADTLSREFFAKPLLQTVLSPKSDPVKLTIKKRKRVKEVVFLNCLDYLYGHCLLKLLNVDRHHNRDAEVVVLIPQFLEWMVPEYVAEIWTVNLSLSQMKEFYLDLDKQVQNQFTRFKIVTLSPALSHPNQVKITDFTQTDVHDFSSHQYRITFIWREDRPWFFSFPISYVARKLNLLQPLLWWQTVKIIWLFWLLKKQIPDAKFTVAGIGTSTLFPSWIDDIRYNRPTTREEKLLCQTYAQSRVVIGVHGSNMLLPSAHAGCVIDLLPTDRLNNFAQDVLYHSVSAKADPRLISFRYRYLPIASSVGTVNRVTKSIVLGYENTKKYFNYINN